MKRIGKYVGVGGIVLIETDPVTESNTRNVIRCDKINLYKNNQVYMYIAAIKLCMLR